MSGSDPVWFFADHPRWTLANYARGMATRLGEYELRVLAPPLFERIAEGAPPPALLHFSLPSLWLREGARFDARLPVVLTFHSERSLSAAEPAAIAAARRGIGLSVGGVSRSIVARLRSVFPDADYVPDGVFLADWASEAERAPRNGTLRVGMFGLLASGKGFHDLLLPVARDLGLTVVSNWRGDAPSGSSFPDEQLWPPEVLRSRYAALDVYAMLSDAEGTPLPLLEAMASGVCPLATRTGAALELIQHALNGYLIDRTQESLREALRALAANPLGTSERGRAARDTLARERDGYRSLAAWRRLYARALGREVHPLDIETPLRIGVVTAHPDDETLWAGGLMITRPWHAWTVLCATASGPREAELRTLGARHRFEVWSAGLPDERGTDLERQFTEALRCDVDPDAWDLLLTHGPSGEYGHPHHIAVHRAVRAWLGNRHAPPVFYFGNGEGSIRTPLTPRVAAEKTARLEHYRAEDRRGRLSMHAARWCAEETLLRPEDLRR